MFKKKYKNRGLESLAEASINVIANPWYAPTPTTVVVGGQHGYNQYYVKEEVDHLIGRIKDATVWHDDDKFLVCLDVDDYTAEQVWVRVDQIVAIIQNKRPDDAHS